MLIFGRWFLLPRRKNKKVASLPLHMLSGFLLMVFAVAAVLGAAVYLAYELLF